MSKLSVITVNRNNARGLLATLESLKNQTRDDFEVIVVDGASTDGSPAIIQKYEEIITRAVSEPDTGIYNAQNKGLAMAAGEYVLFLNSGDFLCDKGVLNAVMPYLDGKSIVYGDMRINWGGGNFSHGKMPEAITKQHMYLDTLWHPVSFIPRSLFHQYGNYDESLKLVADYDFFFKVLIRHNVKAVHIPVEISEFSADGASSSKSNKKREQDERRVVQERYLDPGELDKLAALKNPSWKKWLMEFRDRFI
jgi:glycosyltransferase involved in cell wall biosynthesis